MMCVWNLATSIIGFNEFLLATVRCSSLVRERGRKLGSPGKFRNWACSRVVAQLTSIFLFFSRKIK